MRMNKPDIVELFYLLINHPSTPVTIQQEREFDAAGVGVAVGRSPTLWTSQEGIPYGPSVGPRDSRPIRSFIGESCRSDAECLQGGHCTASGTCSMVCDGLCPDRAGYPWTFCANVGGRGLCTQRADERNQDCAAISGAELMTVSRFVNASGYEVVERTACIPAGT